VTAAHYSIKDLEQITGIKAHTIRIWEKRYKIVQPQRTTTNIRHYTDFDLKRLMSVAILNRHGQKISHIVSMSNEQLNEKIVALTQHSFDMASHIESLMVAMIEVNETKFDKTLTTLFLNLGFEDTFTKVIVPFFEKIGILWQIGTVNPAQEHFITNLIRKKIIVAIDGLIVSENVPNRKKFLLFLPDDELHEIALLYYSYLIQKRGHKVIYLGQMVPFEDIIMLSELQQPDVLFTIFTSCPKNTTVEDYIEKLVLNFDDKKIFVSGIQFKMNQIALPDPVTLIDGYDTFKRELELIEQ
jgi:DNA-binding transcriptional MerR regulator